MTTHTELQHIEAILEFQLRLTLHLRRELMAKLDNLTKSVEKMTNAGDGMRKVLDTLSAELKTALAEDDTSAIEAVVAKMDAKADEWVQAVQANTQEAAPQEATDPSVQTQG